MNQKTLLLLLLTITVVLVITALMFIGWAKSLERQIVTDPVATSTPISDPRVVRPPTTSTSTSVASSTVSMPVEGAWQMTPEVLASLEKRWKRNDPTYIGTSTPDYLIGYSNHFNQYSIMIMSEPAAQYRHEAEAELLTALGITETEACTLDVFVRRSTLLTGLKDYQVIGLSFCAGSVPDAELPFPSQTVE